MNQIHHYAISPVFNCQDSGDLNDDYWRGKNTIIPPGELRVVVGIDNDGWGVANYDTVRGKSTVRIGSSDAGSFVYMEADIVAGVVHDFEYSLNGSTWVDDEADLPASEIRNVGGTDYKFIVQDEWNFTRASFDVFFTISAQTTDKGNMGYLPPDTSSDPLRVNVMNYNTYLLMGPSAHSGKLDYCDRAEAIADNGNRIFANVDILVMEELASQDACTPDAEDLATEEHLCCGPDKPFRDRTELLNGEPLVNGLAGPSETGGVVIMSRYPNSLSGSGRARAEYTDSPGSFALTDEVHYIFREDNDECFGNDPIGVGSGVFDCAMDKGFIRAKFTKSADTPEGTISQDYYIFGTHAQAEDCDECADARTKQFEAIETYAAALPSDVPIIIVGDTNTEHDEVLPMLATLNASKDLPPIHDSHKGPIRTSENYSGNYYSFDQRDSNDGKYDQFDWVLFSNHGLTPSSYEWRNLYVREHENNGRADMSDHEAVLAEFSFHPAEEKVLLPDDTFFIDGEIFQTLIPIPDNGTVVKKVITADYPLDTCNSGSQDVVFLTDSNWQETLFASQQGRQFGVNIPPYAREGDVYVFAEHTSPGPAGYGLEIEQGSVLGMRSVLLTVIPEPAIEATRSIRMSWPDQNDDGILDGTAFQVSQFRLAKDGSAVTGTCEDEPSCSTEYNTFDVEYETNGEFLLFIVLDSDSDGVPDDYDGVVDNCPSISNPSQDDQDNNGIGDACEAVDTDCSPDSITLSTQAEVSMFQTNHGPACTSIAGNLIISGADISDLTGLAGITSIGGYLRIENNNVLETLDGLSGVTAVVSQTVNYVNNVNEVTYFDLAIQNNPALWDCSALQDLLDNVDHSSPGPGPGPAGVPDIGGALIISGNLKGCNSAGQVDTEFTNGFE